MYTCMQHNVNLSSLCKWKRPKMFFFVVKRYAVREAKKWRYAVRNAKICRYLVRKGGGCHPQSYCNLQYLVNPKNLNVYCYNRADINYIPWNCHNIHVLTEVIKYVITSKTKVIIFTHMYTEHYSNCALFLSF